MEEALNNIAGILSIIALCTGTWTIYMILDSMERTIKKLKNKRKKDEKDKLSNTH